MVIKPPPYLIGAVMLFWGWQTDLLWLGAVAGLAIESAGRVRQRWDLAQNDLDRIWNYCVLLFFGAAVVAFASNDGAGGVSVLLNDSHFAEKTEALNRGARAAFLLFQWLPVPLLPIVFAQILSGRDRLDWSTFSWWLRRQRRALSQTTSQTSAAAGLNSLWPFFGACLLGASATNNRTLWFPLGLAFLGAWALWVRRFSRAPVIPWIVSVLVVGAMSVAGYRGLLLLREALHRLESNLVAQWANGRSFDSKESRTMLGAIGRLKLSGRIVLRVQTDKDRPPELLREASFNLFRTPHWMAANRDFVGLAPENDLTSWRLRDEADLDRSVAVRGFITDGEDLLALPMGTARLEDLPAYVLQTNRLGAVRVESGPRYAHFQVAFGGSASIDGQPDANDLDIPLEERNVLERIAEELKLDDCASDEAARRISEFFSSQFRYSTWLSSVSPESENKTPLGAFLLENRSGHCEYFATATVLLLRQAGIPARYAVGYAVQEKSGREWVVRERHAHAWCLVWMGGRWYDWDTTPPDWGAIESQRASVWESVTDLWSRAWWAVSEWRWSESSWRRYAIWVLVPFVLAMGGRLLQQSQWKRVKADVAEKPQADDAPGMDSEFFQVVKRLANENPERECGETLGNWLERIDSSAGRSGELKRLLALHSRLRFDPEGLSDGDRQDLRRAAGSWGAAASMKRT